MSQDFETAMRRTHSLAMAEQADAHAAALAEWERQIVSMQCVPAIAAARCCLA
jgi:hypothetical protein